MKDSKKYSEKFQKALRGFKRKFGKIDKPKYDLSAEPLVFAVLAEHMTESQAAGAIKKLAGHFADWNDLRVSRVEEVLDVLGKDNPQTRLVAENLTQCLFAIFNKYDLVNLESLEEAGKRQAKGILEKLMPEQHFVINYVFLTAFDGHAIPLNATMIEYLKASDLVHPESTIEEIQGFVERQVPANQAYEAYALLRKEAETNPVKKAAAPESKEAKEAREKNTTNNGKKAAKK